MCILSKGLHLVLAFLFIPALMLSGCSSGILPGSSSPHLVSIAITPSTASAVVGGAEQFIATGTFDDGTTQNLTSLLVWSSSNQSIATVASSGMATAVGPGTASIQGASGGVTGSALFTVTGPSLALISVTPSSQSIVTGSTQQYTATGTYTDESKQDLTESVTWSSANSSVATVAASGLAAAVGSGTTTIQAISGSVTGTASLTVTGPALVSISVTPVAPTISTGASQQFAAMGTYSDGSKQNISSSVTWTSSTASIATITESGLATGISAGSTTIQAAVGSVTGTTILTVAGSTLVSIFVTPTSPSIVRGATQQFVATGTYGDGSKQNISTSVAWSSSKTAIATINSAGLATAIAVGTTTIQAASGSVSGSTTLTVTGRTLVSISVAPATATISTGASQQFVATGTYSDGSTGNITTSASWLASNASVATISSSGLATALATGAANIQATVGSITGSATLTVDSSVLLAITIAPSSPSISVGSTQQFTATGTYNNGSKQKLSAVTWSSSSTSVATISSTGLATAVGAGTTTIQSVSGSVIGSTVLTVTNPVLVSISVTPSAVSIAKGASLQFTATGSLNNGTTQNLTASVAWSSSDLSVATISSAGIAAAAAVGNTTVTAASGTISGTATLTVANGIGCDLGGNCYIRAGASGSGTGADWADAYIGFGTGTGQLNPANMSRGVTYWIANGNYGNVSFTTPDSGSQVITIEGATATTHGPAPDWNSSYAGQALFGESAVLTDYWTLDGQTRGADWQSGYTIKFWNQSDPTGAGMMISGNHDLRFDYIEMEGTGAGFPNNTATSDRCSEQNCGNWQDFSIYETVPVANVYVGHGFYHHTGTGQFQMNATGNGGTINSNMIWEYNWISYNHTGQNGQHDEAYSLLANSVTIRYNVFQDISGSGIIVDASANAPAMHDWSVYGNLFFNDAAYLALGPVYWLNSVDQGILVLGDGSGSGANGAEVLSGTFIFANNTIANFDPPGVSCLGTYSTLPIAATQLVSGTANTIIENNLWYNSYCVYGNYTPFCQHVSGTCTEDYNASYSAGLNATLYNWQTQATPAPHDINVSATTDPFTDSSASAIAGFELTTPDPFVASPGVPLGALGAPFDLDMLGITRGANGTWDRGALQLEANTNSARLTAPSQGSVSPVLH